MMKSIHTYILLTVLLMLCGCNEEAQVGTEGGDPVAVSAVRAEIVSGEGLTRATTSTYLEDNISRFQFVGGDKMVFTKIQRTEHALTAFKYRDVAFGCNESGAWERDKTTGVAGEGASQVTGPERIYWSDATSPHTFVGYSLPQVEAGKFDWKKSSFYYDTDGTKRSVDTYYGAIGDPLNASEEIDYNKDESTKTETVTTTTGNTTQTTTFKYSQDLRDEDLLLTYDTDLKADNSVAKIQFHHALSSVRVVVNISGFYGSAADSFSVVSDMKLLEQPTLYRWTQASYKASPLINSQEQNTLNDNALWGATTPPLYDQRKTMNLWDSEPKGVGRGSSKTFTFYGITVPQESDFFSVNQDKALKLKFKVTYPDPLKNNPKLYTISKWYSAEIPAQKSNGADNHVYFHPGQCTTIKVTLNHKDETMTIGASYMSWEYVETPDEGSLKKKSTFLQEAPATRDPKKITIATDAGATMDDATWLYIDETEDGKQTLLDIYGNDGSAERPFTISTADELLSFAYEVKSGRVFTKQYVKLDADITMQKGYDLPMTGEAIDYSKLISWIGIGDAVHAFDGFFLGSNRHINNLYGSPFFTVIGENAVIDKVSFDNVLKVVGDGAVANVNRGLLCACEIEGDVSQSSGTKDTYCGSFVGDNQSFIIGCTHVGEVSGYGYVGGLVGHNAGAIIASYHAGVVKYATTDASKQSNIGGSTGLKDETKSMIFSCYQNEDYIQHSPNLLPGRAAWPRTTAQMQSDAFVNRTSELVSLAPATQDVGTYKSFLLDTDGNDLSLKHYSLNKALNTFVDWLNRQWDAHDDVTDTDWTVDTHCRTFTRNQVYWIKTHFATSHAFKYVPGSYPKVE